jgi:hypothetical protein
MFDPMMVTKSKINWFVLCAQGADLQFLLGSGFLGSTSSCTVNFLAG